MQYVQFIIDRVKEPSTWAGLAAMAGALGFVGAATGFGAVSVFLREQTK